MHYLDKVIGDMSVIYIYKFICKLICIIFRIYYLDIVIVNGNIIFKFCIVRPRFTVQCG
jgi:hypothetical protein